MASWRSRQASSDTWMAAKRASSRDASVGKSAPLRLGPKYFLRRRWAVAETSLFSSAKCLAIWRGFVEALLLAWASRQRPVGSNDSRGIPLATSLEIYWWETVQLRARSALVIILVVRFYL